MGLCLCLVLASACAPRQRPPYWLALDHPRPIGPLKLAAFAERLVEELGEPTYRPSHTSPEELAALAMEQLEQQHPWDAAVLLALASYRRGEQVAYFRGPGAELRRSAILREYPNASPDFVYDFTAKIEEAESNAYSAAVFDDELGRIAALVGAPLTLEAQREDFVRILLGGMNNRHLAAQALTQRVEHLQSPPPPRLAQPAVADALRERLVRVAANPDTHLLGLNYLTSVPLPAFRAAALEAVRLPFAGNVLRTGLWLYQQDPDAVRHALATSGPSSRLHAAAILGLSGDLPNIEPLEVALDEESDLPVRLAIKFALIRLGEHQYLDSLVARLRASSTVEQLTATALVQWLPLDVKLELDVAPLVELIERSPVDGSPVAAFLAAITLTDIGAERPLDKAAFSAIGAVLRMLRSDPAGAAAGEALIARVGQIAQLSRGFTLQQLERSRRGTEVWLSLLRRHVQESDLALLAQLMTRRKEDGVRSWVIRTVAAVPGPAAQGLLERFYTDYPDLRIQVAVALVLREDTDKARLHTMLSSLGEDARHSILDLALQRPGARERVADYLRSDNPNERYSAILAVRFLSDRRFDKDLWLDAGYFVPEYYPADVGVRTAALSALLQQRLNGRFAVLAEAAPQSADEKRADAETDPPGAAPRAVPAEVPSHANRERLAAEAVGAKRAAPERGEVSEASEEDKPCARARRRICEDLGRESRACDAVHATAIQATCAGWLTDYELLRFSLTHPGPCFTTGRIRLFADKCQESMTALCQQGQPVACRLLGQAYIRKQPSERDRDALALFQKACDGGDGMGCASLARMHALGRGTPANVPQSLRDLERGCELASAKSCALLATYHHRGVVEPANEARAAEALLRACELEDADSCQSLGFRYSEGIGVAQDDERAGAMLRRACALGKTDACGAGRELP